MRVAEILGAWRMILAGKQPSLSIEITRECPLRCPGCYAYDDNHLGGGTTLRQLSDFKGDALVQGILGVVDKYKPLHLSLVGGDPLVRYRELDILLPLLIERGVHVQIVTSAFRPINPAWRDYPKLNVTVSIDGLQEDHDIRRAPATYDRILKNIVGQNITIHCTITSQNMKRPGFLEQFVEFWSGKPEIKRIWFSIFTPQLGDRPVEVLSRAERQQVVDELLVLREKYKVIDMPAALLREFLRPPKSPEECIFAQTTATVSADLTTAITPCQFGGTPDCSECGCVASMGLAAIGNFKLGGIIPVGQIFRASARIGRLLQPPAPAPEPAKFPILR